MSARGSGTVVGTVAALRRYPVKSLGGEDLPVAEVREGGVVGDRTHAVVDRRTGKVGSAKNPRLWRALLAMSATACPDVGASGDGDGRGRAPEVSITLPGGATVSSSDPRVHELLSEVLGRPVRLADERPPGAEIETVPGVAGFVENRWVGGRLRIGARLIVRVAVNTPRCAIPTLAHGELPRDTNALRMLADHNRLPVPGRAEVACAGVYAQVVEPGTIRHGDQVRLLPSDGDR